MAAEDSSAPRILPDISRRNLFRTIGLATGGAMLLGLPKFLGGGAGVAEAALREGFATRSTLALELDGKFVCFLESVAGGNAYAEIIQEDARSGYRQKAQGTVKFEDLVIEASLIEEIKPLLAWINDTQTKNTEPRNGAIVYADMNYNEVKRLEFFGAMISGFAMDTADARSGKDAVGIVVTLTPQSTRLSGGKGKMQGGAPGVKAKPALSGAFRFNIQGLEKACGRIVKVQGIGYKRSSILPPPGGTRARLTTTGLPQYSMINLFLPEADAAPFYQWFDDAVLKGKAGSERGALLEWLDPTFKATLASVQLGGLGILRYAPEPVKTSAPEVVPLVQIDMYCETLTVTL